MKEKVIVLYSGGMGSFLSANLIKNKNPEKDIVLYFNDTYMESNDLYLFLLNTLNYFDPCKETDFNGLHKLATTIPNLSEEKKRKQHLYFYGRMLERSFSFFKYDPDGRNIYEVFKDVRFMGNSRIDPCSRVLKRERAQTWIRENFNPNEVKIAFGIDYTEKHRLDRAKPYWEPYKIFAPLIDDMLDKQEYEKEVFKDLEFNKSNSYVLGLAHDNCGGFCVKAGLGAFKLLLETRPEVYNYHVKKEKEIYDEIGRHPFLKKQVDGVKYYITLEEYKTYLQEGVLISNGEFVKAEDHLTEEELLEYGGCGCAL